MVFFNDEMIFNWNCKVGAIYPKKSPRNRKVTMIGLAEFLGEHVIYVTIIVGRLPNCAIDTGISIHVPGLLVRK